MDYLSVTRGGGQGGYKNIVFGPASVQEVHDHMQWAFHLADKHRNPVIVLMDGILGLLSERVAIGPIDFEPLPEKTWALRGRDHHADGRSRQLHSSVGVMPYEPFTDYGSWLKHVDEKFRRMAAEELRSESYHTEDAELILVAYGYVARVARQAVDLARDEGLKVGLLRPITLWPFPYQTLKDLGTAGARFLVVEDSLGLMIDDVRLGVEGQGEIHFLGMLDRHIPTDGGMIMPGRVLEEVRKLL